MWSEMGKHCNATEKVYYAMDRIESLTHPRSDILDSLT